MKSRISCVIDVRKNPIARRYGFHKSTMAQLLDKLDIEYVHFPQLGIDSSARKGLQTREDYRTLLDTYESTVLEQQETALANTAKLLQEKPGVLLCMEADPSLCHRTRVANRVAALTDLPVIDLGAH